MEEEQLANCMLALAISVQICTWMSEFWLEICFSQQWCSSGLTCAVGGVDGLVSLDEDDAWMEGHQDDFLELAVRELSLQVHIQLYVVILTEFNGKDLCIKRQSIRENRMGDNSWYWLWSENLWLLLFAVFCFLWSKCNSDEKIVLCSMK